MTHDHFPIRLAGALLIALLLLPAIAAQIQASADTLEPAWPSEAHRVALNRGHGAALYQPFGPEPVVAVTWL
jgi:hypothetical protein